jgi:V/A-type H+-transporting ATPase subunit B
VIGKVTREDHGQIMNAMIRFFSSAREAEQKQQMSFELSDFDHKLLKFGRLFRDRFMKVEVAMPLVEALDLCWETLAECFEPQELLMKDSIVAKYYPHEAAAGSAEATGPEAA